MGVTIHYRGKLNDAELIGPIYEELKDIANEMDWRYSSINEELDGSNTSYIDNKGHIKGTIPLKGIEISIHPKSESLSFLFDKQGNMRNLVTMALNKEEAPEESICSIKTQFAPIEIHISVIKLLRYIKKKYMSNLEIFDEGSYWETEDREQLNEKISFLNRKMDELEGILHSIEKDDIDTTETVIKKIEEALKKRYGKSVQIKKSKK